MSVSVNDLKDRIDAGIEWVNGLVENADQAGEKVMKMYPAFPLALKVTNAAEECEKVQHFGNSRVVWTAGRPAALPYAEILGKPRVVWKESDERSKAALGCSSEPISSLKAL